MSAVSASVLVAPAGFLRISRSLSGLSALTAKDRLRAARASADLASIFASVAVPNAWICAEVASTDSLALNDFPSASFPNASDTFSAADSSLTAPQAARPPARTVVHVAATRVVRTVLRITVLMTSSCGTASRRGE